MTIEDCNRELIWTQPVYWLLACAAIAAEIPEDILTAIDLRMGTPPAHIAPAWWYASDLPLRAAKKTGRKAMEIAEVMADFFRERHCQVNVTEPGFLNLGGLLPKGAG